MSVEETLACVCCWCQPSCRVEHAFYYQPQDEDNDRALAEHVLFVHTKGAPPQPAQAPLSPALLRAFVARAKTFEPHVPEVRIHLCSVHIQYKPLLCAACASPTPVNTCAQALAEYVAAVYAELRAEEAASDMPHSYTTARTLLSILRLSQALARLRFDTEVVQVCVC